MVLKAFAESLVFMALILCCHCSGGGGKTSEEPDGADTAGNDDAGTTDDDNDDGNEVAADGDDETETAPGSQQDDDAPEIVSSLEFINGGDTFTTGAAIRLALSATDNLALTAYYIAQESDAPAGDAEGWIDIEATPTYSAELDYELQGGFGEKTLFVWFKDGSGNISEPAYDGIFYVGPDLREVSYYPRDYAWEEMWLQWPIAKTQMDDDLADMASLGVNTVRIFLMPDIFGYPSPSTTYLEYFEEAVSLIASHGMRAHVNLFDCWYSHADVGGSLTWLESVMQDRQHDDRIAVWELQNEIVLDDAVVRSWLTQVFPTLKELAGEAYATVSVVQSDDLDDITALTAPDPPDLYSLHWYPDGDMQWTNFLSDELDDALAGIGSAELLIGEFGYPAYRYSAESQAKLYRDMFFYAREKNIPHLGFWTFTDFPSGTAQCGGVVPSDASQFYYGISDASGNERESASVVATAWDGDGVSTAAAPGPDNASFESASPAGYVQNWITWDQSWSGTQRYFQDCSLARTGACSARIVSEANVSVGFYAVPALKVDPSGQYGAVAFVRTANLNGSVQLTLSWYSWDGSTETWISNTGSNPITTGNLGAWTELAMNGATPPANADLALLFIQVLSTTTGSEVWVDDVMF